MVYGFIYKITFDNGKNYIGLTTSLEDRIKEHKQCAKSGNNRILYNALRKFKMEDTFELIKIDSANTNEELCQKEKYYIYQYNSYFKNGKGYNMTYGGEGSFGHKFTKKQRQNCSEAKKEYYKDPEAIKKNRETQKKVYRENPELAQKLSKIKKEYYKDPEAIKKNSEAQKNYYRNNPEVRKKIAIKRWGQNKPFDVFKKDGTFIKTFTYQFEAIQYLKEEFNINSIISIGSVLRGKLNSSAGFVFKYK
jgi:group I intron endonuclease